MPSILIGKDTTRTSRQPNVKNMYFSGQHKLLILILNRFLIIRKYKGVSYALCHSRASTNPGFSWDYGITNGRGKPRRGGLLGLWPSVFVVVAPFSADLKYSNL